MKAISKFCWAGALLVICAGTAQSHAATLYVSQQSTNPVPPYGGWTTAAVNIQDAITATQPGDTVLVSNGVYASGGGVIYGMETNRVALTNPITLLSVNGPLVTFINGGARTRCAYVGTNAVLCGFTLTNGQAMTSANGYLEGSGGGVWSEASGMVTNCIIASNFANFLGGGVYGGTFYNCLISSNNGGGACSNTLYNCTISQNIGTSGAGISQGTAWNCTIVSNVFSQNGGGAYVSQLYNCTVAYNVGDIYSADGAGAFLCTLSNCIVQGNQTGSSGEGGGTYEGTNFDCYINQNVAGGFAGGGTYNSYNTNCVIWANSVNDEGGGTFGGADYNCSISGNTASVGGGMYGSAAFNSIIYFNTAPSGPNWSSPGGMEYCCTTPVNGAGCVTADPQFVDAGGGDLDIRCASPCIGAGVNSPFTPNTDIRGLPRPVSGTSQYDIGAYEYTPDAEPSAGMRTLPFTSFAPGYTVTFTAQVGGCADYYYWTFGDGTIVSNQSSVNHAWTAPGAYNVVLSAYYSAYTELLSATTQVQVVPTPVYYVNVTNHSPQAPYTNWSKAATSIQEAIAAGSTAGRMVLVTNGLYNAGGITVNGSLLNTVALTNPVVVTSVNGPGVTTIQVAPVAAGRCAYVGNYAVLTGFTLSGGATLDDSGVTNIDQSGGGVWSQPLGMVSNCVIVSNRANYFGGGAFQGNYCNCTFSNNSVNMTVTDAQGGGASCATLYNCAFISNSAPFGSDAGGGAAACMLTQCLFSNNTAALMGGGAYASTLCHCALISNSAYYGGGSDAGNLFACSLSNNGAYNGGGGCSNVLWNCIVAGNRGYDGGGLCNDDAINCTIVNNYATNDAGGFFDIVATAAVTATNCIIYYNTNGNTNQRSTANIAGVGELYNCCSFPSAIGPDCITNAPLFINLAAGDYHLHFGSPCIDTGANLTGVVSNDFSGTPRPLDGKGDGIPAYDMGAYEFNLLATVGTNWLLSYGLDPGNPLVFTLHPNGNPYSVLQSWIADTDPNVYTPLQILSVSNIPPATVYFNGSSNRVYSLLSSLVLPPVWTPVPGETNLPGLGGLTSLQDPNSTNAAEYYQIMVSVP